MVRGRKPSISVSNIDPREVLEEYHFFISLPIVIESQESRERADKLRTLAAINRRKSINFIQIPEMENERYHALKIEAREALRYIANNELGVMV